MPAIDPPPHGLEDEIGLRPAAPDRHGDGDIAVGPGIAQTFPLALVELKELR